MRSPLNITSLTYHRNGVCGIGFVVASFSFKEDRKVYKAIATIFNGESDDETKFTGHCAVLLLDDNGCPRTNWRMRGDHFEEELRRFIASRDGQVMMFPYLATA